MKVLGVIPARYKSSRFPGKPLALIDGVPMVIRVARIVEQALGKKNTYVATDDIRIKDQVESFGYKAVMTSDKCLTGTDRLWDFAQKTEADIYINIQGDEPMLNPMDILKISEAKKKTPDYVINGMCEIKDEDISSVNIPKVLVNKDNQLIYMSRLPIPGIKDIRKGIPGYYKQVCIYAFDYKDLKAFGKQNKKAKYEFFEDIEILRFFDLGVPIKMVETSGASLAVDVPEDILKIEKALKKSQTKND
ncbi:3-deoxy-manno-octulosonate cytidylyltransferase [Ascidiimonas aurantiaca]|uniref:3-deoxy-manno-octulosonate cytidylyltransferase n=1 Tax=Ascidiimonas aurantiaca TaxID=1685432 RepID=UPI0030ED31A2